MDSAHRSGHRIVEQNRGAVSGKDPQSHTGGVGNKTVALRVGMVVKTVGIRIGDDTIARAAQRYEEKMAVVRGV